MSNEGNPAAEIRARGSGAGETVSVRIQQRQLLRLGRSPERGWTVPWDQMISREHADLCLEGDRLRVTCLETARNPLLFAGGHHREIRLGSGESFGIGATRFQVVLAPAAPAVPADAIRPETQLAEQPEISSPAEDAPDVLSQRTYSPSELRTARFGNAERQIELLARLPQLISSTGSDEDLAQLLVGLLLEAIPQAAAAAVVQYDMPGLTGETAEQGFEQPRMMRVETSPLCTGRFRPSRRLIATALRQQQSVVQIWGAESGSQFTMSEGLGWAFAAPVPGDSCRGWCLYVSGKGGKSGTLLIREEDLAGDLRFTELLAQFIGSVRQVRLLQEQRTHLSTFFSPHVVEHLTSGRHADVLTPAQREISVLFCDVRGFSSKAEELRDQLPLLLSSVRAALGIMVGCIVERDGTIADLQGDAALGFWGWPVPLQDGPLPACRAGLAIEAEFRRGVEPLRGFAVGLGIAHGAALAGQIGTARHPKLGVFGPVVNQGARLEGMTRLFGVSICVDAATAEAVRAGLPPSEARLRCLGRVLPMGMRTPVTAYALLPPEDVAPEITAPILELSAQALDAVVQGRWSAAARCLDLLPEHDGPAVFLRSLLAGHNYTTPPDWDGLIRLATK